jgi:hypothetical protein
VLDRVLDFSRNVLKDDVAVLTLALKPPRRR